MSETQPVFSDSKIEIIAEAGCNHGGDMDTAIEMVRVAKECGANVIKFQAYKTDQLVNPGPIEDFCRRSELSKQQFLRLRDKCDSLNIRFMASAFDIDSLEMLFEMGEDCVKIPSGQIHNRPLLTRAALYNFKIYLSTGMCDMGDVRNAVNLLYGAGVLPSDLTVMQCTTAYPCKIEDLNLRVIKSYSDEFKCKVGISDHSKSMAVTMLSRAIGASAFEAHFKLDETPGIFPDYPVSFSPQWLSIYISSLRDTEKYLGTGVKSVLECEKQMLHRKDVR